LDLLPLVRLEFTINSYDVTLTSCIVKIQVLAYVDVATLPSLVYMRFSFFYYLYYSSLLSCITIIGIGVWFTMSGISSAKFNMVKFDGSGNFRLWQKR